MEMNSSGEDVTIRTRKPYTITKQRERWTSEEHNRFLEALKLYGRAWQRIEEHIGTKTAVQIRSHAQKFFSKLEREASAKGLPIEDAHEIKIPPPRPKRKPNNPYPRKMVVSAPTAKDCPVSSTFLSKPMLNIESPVKGNSESEMSSIQKEYLNEARSAEILALFQEAPCASPSSESNKGNPVRGAPSLSRSGAFREFMPPKSDAKDQQSKKLDIDCNNDINLETGDLVESDSSGLTVHSNAKIGLKDEVDKSDKLGDPELLQKVNAPSSQCYPRHVPVHIVDTNIARPLEIQSPNVTNSCSGETAKEYPSNLAPLALYTASSALHHPFTPFEANPGALKSAAAYVSSTLSNFIISSLVQNPAAHAAANIAALFWPDMIFKEACPDEALKAASNGISSVEPCANVAAVAAATVTAASAWWASQSLVPICHPHASFPFSLTPSVAATLVTETSPCLNSDAKEERKKAASLEPELSQEIETTCPAPGSPPLSSDSGASACGGSERTKPIVTSQEPKKLLASDFHEIGKTKAKKQQHHSSCGSNTTSSSEVDADNVHEDVKKASEALALVHTFGDIANRRSRNTGNNNDSWKEVTEEGRLAFQALFSSQVLPQSFSQRDDIGNMGHTKSCSEAVKQDSGKKESWIKEEKTVLTGCKSNGSKTGFKPYKRCSVEAKEIMISQVTEKALKRIRIEREAGEVILMPISGSGGEMNCSS